MTGDNVATDGASWQIEWGKLIILGIALLAGFGLVFAAIFAMAPDDGRFAATLAFGTGTVGSVIGYATGNGRLASRGQPVVPMIGRSNDSAFTSGVAHGVALAAGELTTPPISTPIV